MVLGSTNLRLTGDQLDEVAAETNPCSFDWPVRDVEKAGFRQLLQAFVCDKQSGFDHVLSDCGQGPCRVIGGHHWP